MNPVTTRPDRRSAPRLLATILALVALATALAGCGASATPSASLGPIELNGTNWLLVSYLSPTGTSYTVPSAVTPVGAFQDGQFTGSTGCNSANGPYTQDGTSIAIGPIASTKQACEEPMLTVEAAYLAAIAVVDTAVGNDKTLILRQSDGFTALEFVRGN